MTLAVHILGLKNRYSLMGGDMKQKVIFVVVVVVSVF